VSVVAAAWADTAEPKKLKELQPDELFYTINDFKNWLADKT
jgi:phosphoglycolate phosphatase/pyrophosphatase PpaX